MIFIDMIILICLVVVVSLGNPSNVLTSTGLNMLQEKRKINFGRQLPSRHMFGSLDFSLLNQEGSKIKFQLADEEKLGFEPKGISLSFYLDSIEKTVNPQKILSVYGTDVLAHSHMTESDKCSMMLNVKELKFNITYDLGGCTRRHIYLDIYNRDQRKTSSLYEDLTIVHGEASRGWCKYQGYYLKESNEKSYTREDYSHPRLDEHGNDTLEYVKELCLKKKKSIAGDLCRGITLMKNDFYTLRVGDVPQESWDGETSYLNGPCLEEGSSVESPSQVLELHKVASQIKLSHINIDHLRDVTDQEEAIRRWRRYELGNMEKGQLVNFENITYNADFNESATYNLIKSTSTYLPLSLSYGDSMNLAEYIVTEKRPRRYDNVVISEGMFIQESFRPRKDKKGSFFKVRSANKNVAANFLWRDERNIYAELRYCIKDTSVQQSLKKEISDCLQDITCCGINSDRLPMKDYCSLEEAIVWKGFCGDDKAQNEERIFFLFDLSSQLSINAPGYGITAHQFRYLPKINGAFTKEGNKCNFTSSGGFSNDITALLTFKTPKDGFRLLIQKTEDKSQREKFVRVNESENQAIMHKINLNNSEQMVSLLKLGENVCESLEIMTFTADICEPKIMENNYGYFFLDRALYNEPADIPCGADSGVKTSWLCRDGTWILNSNECPFYQCYEPKGRTHNSIYTLSTRVHQILEAGKSTSGKCCGNGSWKLKCKKDFSVNYENCTKMQQCSGTQTLQYYVDEKDNTTSMESVTVSELLAAGKKVKVDCQYGRGKVEIYCDGCSGSRLVLSNDCTPQICVRAGFNLQHDLTWINNIKFHHKVFVTLIKGPFRVGDDQRRVKCQYGGELKIGCNGTHIIEDTTFCTPAPICKEQEFVLGPLRGNVTFRQAFAGDSTYAPCPMNNEFYAMISCNADGEWTDLDYDKCDQGPCGETTYVERGVKFYIKETAPGELSKDTSCYLDSCPNKAECEPLEMCSKGTCGSKHCNSTIGGFNKDGKYTTCQFNCTYEEVGTGQVKVIKHGTEESFTCKRKHGDMGIRYVKCYNWKATPTACLLKTCPSRGGPGCVVTNPEALKTADPGELASDLDSFLDNVDLSSDRAKEDTKNVMNAIMSNSPDKSKMSREDKVNIINVVEKVAATLARSGGKIAAEGVTMYGVPASSLKKRSSDKKNHLTENGVVGTGYNGSVGLSIYKDPELFTPTDTTKEKLVGTTVTSLTTAFKSKNIDVNFSFRLRMDCDASAMQCRYLVPETGEWRTDGVNTTCDGRTVTCQSNHLTSFAVLVSLDMIEDHKQSIVTKILVTISIACLSATVISFIPFRKLRSREIIRIHLFLIATSIVANLAFLSLDATGSVTGCYIATFITHFAWLSVFGWMIAEGITMYRQTVRALKSYGRKIEHYALKCAFIVYGLALITPLLGIMLHFTMKDKFQYIRASYVDANDNNCFLDTPNTLVYLFLVPLYVVLCISLYLFIRVSLVVVQSKRHSTSKSVDQGSFWKKQAKALSSIATATGIAWIIAPFVILGAKSGTYATVMQWVFNIVLGSQGIITFLVLVVLSDEVKNCWREAYKGSQMEKFGEAFASIGGGIGTLYTRKKSRKPRQHNGAGRRTKEPKTTLLDQTKSTNFFSNLGRSREMLFHNLFSKAHSSTLVNETTHSSHQSNVNPRTNTPDDVFSPVEEVSSVFQQGSDSWVKFVEKAEGGIIPSEPSGSGSVVERRNDMASDSGFHGDEDMSTQL